MFAASEYMSGGTLTQRNPSDLWNDIAVIPNSSDSEKVPLESGLIFLPACQ
jgi:hypothetical protein